MHRRILLADDDDDDHLIFADAIREIDDAIICDGATDGKAVLDKLAGCSQLPDILFLDINMPLLNGFECLKKLKEQERFAKIPVVIYSTTANDSAIETARSLGASLFLPKPPDHKILSVKLKRTFEILFPVAENAGCGHEFLI